MSEQDSDKKNPSTASSQSGGKSGGTGSAKGGSAAGSASGSSSGGTRKAASGGAKRTGGGQARSRGGRGGAQGQDPYQTVPRNPAPDALQAHGRLPVSDKYQVAPRVWPD
ncbi:MAG TPA: hypothetical protein VKA55_00750 [Gammaproteobacteria bacterium]|nr:hypothetical protein [Gammaproteobacteria bacterium]